MKKKFSLLLGGLLLFASCNNSSTEVKNPDRQLAGAPYETEMDNRAKDAEAFIRESNPDLGEVTKYKRQIVKGVNHYFEFTKEGTPPMEIVVHQDLDGNFTIVSKGVLE